MLNPGEVGVPGGWGSEPPACIFAEPLSSPIAGVEGRVGKDVIGFQILVKVAMEAVGVFEAEVGSMPRMARFIAASFQVVGFDSWP
jgi:hypothetical protein